MFLGYHTMMPRACRHQQFNSFAAPRYQHNITVSSSRLTLNIRTTCMFAYLVYVYLHSPSVLVSRTSSRLSFYRMLSIGVVSREAQNEDR